jgi:hypothetical protein
MKKEAIDQQGTSPRNLLAICIKWSMFVGG